MGQSNNPYGAKPYDMRQAAQGLLWLPIAASQTLTKGDFVILSSGLVAIALASSSELVGVIAQDCASLDTNTLVPVYADPATVFEVIADADSSSVVAGTLPDIIGSTGAMMMDADASSKDHLIALRSNPDDSTSSAYCRWLVKINKHEFGDDT